MLLKITRIEDREDGPRYRCEASDDNGETLGEGSAALSQLLVFLAVQAKVTLSDEDRQTCQNMAVGQALITSKLIKVGDEEVANLPIATLRVSRHPTGYQWEVEGHRFKDGREMLASDPVPTIDALLEAFIEAGVVIEEEHLAKIKSVPTGFEAIFFIDKPNSKALH